MSKPSCNYEPGLSFRRYKEIGAGLPLLTVNASILKEPTPLHAKWKMREDDDGTTDAMALGDALHKAVLEPASFDERFDDYYLMSPTKGLDTKAAQEARALNPDHILVNETIIEKVKYMREAVFRHRRIAALLDECTHRELSGVAPDPQHGCARKIRIDACHGIGVEGESWGPFLLDIKTTRKIEPRPFRYEILDRGYDIQAAFYLDTDAIITGQKRMSFLFAAVSNIPPYCARLYGVLDAELEKARERYKDRLAALVQAFHDNDWSAWDHEEEPVPVFLEQK